VDSHAVPPAYKPAPSGVALCSDRPPRHQRADLLQRHDSAAPQRLRFV